MKPPAVILAGGRSSRMGRGDKCLLPVGGRPMIGHIIETLEPQAQDILINTNSDALRFSAFGYEVLPDTISGLQGPLAGLLTGMLWARQKHYSAPFLLTVPSDTPTLPDDLAARLQDSLVAQKGDVAIAACPAGTHPTIGLWPVDLAAKLEFDLMETSVRSVHGWIRQFRVATALFESHQLANINTPQDLAAMERLAASQGRDRTALPEPSPAWPA